MTLFLHLNPNPSSDPQRVIQGLDLLPELARPEPDVVLFSISEQKEDLGNLPSPANHLSLPALQFGETKDHMRPSTWNFSLRGASGLALNFEAEVTEAWALVSVVSGTATQLSLLSCLECQSWANSWPLGPRLRWRAQAPGLGIGKVAIMS